LRRAVAVAEDDAGGAVTVGVGTRAGGRPDLREGRVEVGVVELDAFVDVAADAGAGVAADPLDVVGAALDAGVVHVDLRIAVAVDPEHLVQARGLQQLRAAQAGREQQAADLLVDDLATERCDLGRQRGLVAALVDHDQVVPAGRDRLALDVFTEQERFQAVGRLVEADPADLFEVEQAEPLVHLHQVAIVRQVALDLAAGALHRSAVGIGRGRTELHDVEVDVGAGLQVGRHDRDRHERVELPVLEHDPGVGSGSDVAAVR
jgi:hypothetical protein